MLCRSKDKHLYIRYLNIHETLNFINNYYGKVTLYKSKKRLELRLKKEIFKKSTLLYEISS